MHLLCYYLSVLVVQLFSRLKMPLHLERFLNILFKGVCGEGSSVAVTLSPGLEGSSYNNMLCGSHSSGFSLCA